CLFWRARLIAPLSERPADAGPSVAGHAPKPRTVHPAIFGRREVMTSRYEGADLLPGTAVAGPAIVDEMTTTIVVPPGSVLRATKYNYVVGIAAEAQGK